MARNPLPEHYNTRTLSPSPYEVACALDHLPPAHALAMLHRAAIRMGEWTPQLLATARLIAQRGARA